jgi:hypothetical protein
MIIGIDIGVTGCIAVLSASGELIEVHTMPCRRPRRPARGKTVTRRDYAANTHRNRHWPTKR